MRSRREQRGAPVEHDHPVTVGEQVERMQVTVADDVRGRRGRVIGQPAGHPDQVGAPELGGELRQHRDQASH
jgi:hypothetical protein